MLDEQRDHVKFLEGIVKNRMMAISLVSYLLKPFLHHFYNTVVECIDP